MAFINGFLALLSAAGTGTATEFTGATYRRQPIAFSRPVNGHAVSSVPYTFGFLAVPGPMAARAIYDAPTGGNLLLVMPFATARPVPAGGPTDANEACALHLQFDALAGWPDGDAYSGTFTGGTVIGTAYDDAAVLTRHQVNLATGGYSPVINTGPLSAGVGLTITRGVLRAT